MSNKRAERLKKFYKLWLPIYRLINKPMVSDYKAAMPTILKDVEINDTTSILDIGTGTGGLAGVLLDYTSQITAIDFSPEMINEARKNYGDRIIFIDMEASELTRFENGSFDLVTAAFCLHDMSDEYRLNVLEQMHRIARNKVIIFDLIKTNNLIIRTIEVLEGSYYKDYIKHIDGQLASIFPEVKQIIFNKMMQIYICDI